MPEYQMRLITAPNRKIFRRKLSSAASLTLIFLLIEFFDELHFGIHGATLPSIRTSLGLNYNQASLPGIMGASPPTGGRNLYG